MRYATAVFLATLILVTTPSFAHTGGKVDVEIVNDGGGVFSAIPFRNYLEGKTRIIKKYIEARSGENYSIILRNNTRERVGVVLAVDGRNIITGKRSSLNNNERMYILDPYSSAQLEGWRTDKDTVHTFYFTDASDSYAIRTFGDSSSMGVIAVAVFREKERPMHYERNLKRENAPAPSAGSAAESRAKSQDGRSAGTGFGDTRYSPVMTVKFEPESSPFEKILMKYEWREVLCKKGILHCPPRESNRLWDEGEYAPYPPEYDTR